MTSKIRIATGIALASLTVVLGAIAFRAPEPVNVLPAGPGRASEDAGTAVRSAAPQRQGLAPQRETGAYWAPVGRAFAFSYDAAFETEMVHQQAPDQATRARQSNAGAMQVTVVDRRAGELLLEVSFPGTTGFAINDGRRSGLEDTCRELGGVFGLRMADDGRVLGYRFPECGGPTRRLVRTLVWSFHFVVPEGATDTWKTEEADANGVFRARYRDLGTVDDQRRMQRARIAGTATGPSEDEAVFEGAANGTLHTGLGWMSAANVDESMAMELTGTGMSVAYAMKARLALESWTDGVAPRGTHDWDADESPASGELDAEEPAADADLCHVNVHAVLAELRRLAATEDGLDHDTIREMMRTLTALVRARPEVLEELMAFALDATSDTLAVKTVLAAVGAADTAPAQGLIAEVLGTEGLREGVRVAAAAVTLGLSRPNAKVMAALTAAAMDTDAPGRVPSTSLLMLGSCASRCEDAPVMMQRLLAMEQALQDSGRLGTWLGALGNAGTRDVIPVAMRYASSQDPALRVRAIDALRLVEDPRVGEILRDRVARETDLVARDRAVELLAQRTDRASLDAVLGLLARGTRADRLAAVRGLGRQTRTNPAAVQLLRDVAGTHPDPGIRQAALATLGQG